MAKRKRPLRPEDIYLLRMVSDPQLSPDGKRVAYTVSASDEESDSAHIAIYVAPIDGREAPVRFTQGEHDHSPHWSPDGRYLAFTDNGREHTGQEVVSWAKRVEELGAGEICLTSVDREGTGNGYDLELIRQVCGCTL